MSSIEVVYGGGGGGGGQATTDNNNNNSAASAANNINNNLTMTSVSSRPGSVTGGRLFNSIYTDSGQCKVVIVQDDEKFPSPRLCLLRRWPNFEGGFGFKLYEDLISAVGALKVEEVVRHSPAEAGGLRINDVIIEINGDNIEYQSFFRLVEILKEACSQNEMELLVIQIF